MNTTEEKNKPLQFEGQQYREGDEVPEQILPPSLQSFIKLVGKFHKTVAKHPGLFAFIVIADGNPDPRDERTAALIHPMMSKADRSVQNKAFKLGMQAMASFMSRSMGIEETELFPEEKGDDDEATSIA